MNPLSVRFRFFFLAFFTLLLLPTSSRAAEPTATLTVSKPSAPLYSRQDERSDVISELKNGDTLVPIAEAVGTETWYLVQTTQGLTGWMRAGDVFVSEKARETFRQPPEEQNITGSVWTAQDDKGRTFRGTWTVDQTPLPDKASGTWTLDAGSGKPAVHGIWSAQKFSTGWSGTWRATVDGQKTEYTGSWTAEFPKAREPHMNELFEAASRDVIRGIWSSGTSSGNWSIRTTK